MNTSKAPRDRRGAVVLGCVVCGCLILAAAAWAAESFTITAYFTPDKLGAPANLSAKTSFTSGGGPATPVGNILAYGPAGLIVDVRGTGVCQRTTLEDEGPSACPADSRIGFGGGIGLVEIANEVIKEPFTLNLFLGPRENGHLLVYVYVNAVSPVSVQLVLSAKEVRGPKPYGLGVTIEVPPIPTLPGGSYASVESTYLTIGSQKVAYYQTVRGKKKLIHVRGLVIPKGCPQGGFPFLVTIDYLDNTSSTDRYAAPCPRK